MKYIKHLLFILFCLNTVAQNGGNTSSTNLKLPDFISPSPQASELSKYGNVPLNESAGVANVSIPLPDYKVGDLSIPLNLTYSGDGVKVEEVPTWTGIDWNLNVGGVITRVVKDLPDDYNKPRYFYSKENLDTFKQFVNTVSNTGNGPNDPPYIVWPLTGVFINNPNLYPLYKFPDDYDSLNDEYRFSFPGYSGTFIMIKNSQGIFEAKLLKKDAEIKIEVIGEFKDTVDYQFLITTPEGIKYYFGGETLQPGATIFDNVIATERSQYIDRSVSPPIFGKSAKTSFYLTKIEHFKGEKIFLEYQTNEDYEVHSRKNQRISVPMFGALSTISSEEVNNNNIVRNKIYNGKFLKRIWNNRDVNSLIFDSFSVLRTENNISNVLKYRVLKNINYGDISVVFDYDKTYTSLANGSADKFFLKKVVKSNNANNNVKEEYNLEYQNGGNIENTSNSQDYLGFYNGANNSILVSGQPSKFFKHYLLNLTDVTIDDNIENTFKYLVNRAKMEGFLNYFADREPNFELATNGILKKIIYPTKGFTEFEYEPVDKKLLYKTKTLRIYNNMGNTPLLWTPSTVYTDENGISSTYINIDGNPDPNVFTSQEVDVNLTIHVDESVPVVDMDLDYHDFIYVRVTNTQTGVFEEKRFHFPSEVTTAGYSNKDFNAVLSFNITKDNGYIFKIGFGNNSGGIITYLNSNNVGSAFTNTPLYVDANYTYISGVNESDGLGIRIKRVKDYTAINSTTPSQIKRVYYKKLKEIFINQNEFDPQIYFPLFYGARIVGSAASNPNDPNNENLPVILLDVYSHSTTLDLPSNMGESIYKYVTISEGGDNFEKGGVEKKFLIEKDSYAQSYIATPFYFYQERYGAAQHLLFNLNNFNDNSKTNHSNNNGLLLSESVWKKRDNNLFKIKKNINYYNFQNIAEFYDTGGSLFNNGMNIANGYSGVISPLYGNFWDIQFALYSHIQSKSEIIYKYNTDFIDEVPLSQYYPQVLYHGWEQGDHDNDGIPNSDDQTFITPAEMASMTDEDIESTFKKIDNTQSFQYDSSLVGLPSVVNSLNSVTGEVKTTKYYYPTTSFLNILSPEPNTVNMLGYNSLKDAHRLSTPIQTETYRNNLLLSKERIVYKNWEEVNSSFPEKIQYAKGNQLLEDRIIFLSYDNKWNPNLLKMADGALVKYVFNNNNQPLLKIENYLTSYNSIAITDSSFANSCYLINLFPSSLASVFTYDPITKLLKEVKDPNCRSTYYFYDELRRLKQIKDDENNVIKEFDTNYRPN